MRREGERGRGREEKKGRYKKKERHKIHMRGRRSGRIAQQKFATGSNSSID